jgi:hypothetical protein
MEMIKTYSETIYKFESIEELVKALQNEIKNMFMFIPKFDGAIYKPIKLKNNVIVSSFDETIFNLEDLKNIEDDFVKSQIDCLLTSVCIREVEIIRH